MLGQNKSLNYVNHVFVYRRNRDENVSNVRDMTVPLVDWAIKVYSIKNISCKSVFVSKMYCRLNRFIVFLIPHDLCLMVPPNFKTFQMETE